MIYRFNCLRCSHEWASKLDRPRVCPKCKSPYWDTERDQGVQVISVEADKCEHFFSKKVQRNKWGRWKYNPKTHCLEIKKQLGGLVYDYEVDLDRCDTGARLLDWIYQVKTKRWASPDDIADLIYAVDDILEYVQDKLCSFGINRKFAVKKFLFDSVDPLFKKSRG